MSILNQNLLTLDFWKDEVTYAGHTLPTGSIGCAAMNISDEQIGQLMQLAIPLAAVVELIKDGTPTAEHFTVAKESVLQITQMMRTTYPFSLFDFPADGHDIQQIFSREYTDNAIAYINAAQEIGITAALDEQYEVDALHYLIKPISLEKLTQVLTKATEKLSVEPLSVVISSDGETVKLYESDIRYVESFLHYIVIHTKDKEYKIKENMSVFEKRVSDDFYRIHRSYLVSLKHITRISRTSVNIGNTELPLSRGKYDDINRAFIQHN